MEKCPPLHLGVVAIKKGAFRSPSTKVAKLYLLNLIEVNTKVISETQKMVLDAALLNTEHYKVRIKSKVVQSML